MRIRIAAGLLALVLNSAVARADAPQAAAAPAAAAALPSPTAVYRDALARGDYLGPLLFLREHEAEYLAQPGRRGLYLDVLALLHSFVGDQPGVYAAEERFLAEVDALSNGAMRKPRERDLALVAAIDGYASRDAFGPILQAADEHQVLMINEEHRTPVHRAFTHRLLPALRARGFRYLALEALAEDAAVLRARGHPVYETGIYTNDPVFADLIRDALKLGFQVVPYEYEGKCEPKPDQPMFCANERERGQAENIIARILKNDPQAKILVHVGRDHNAEAGQGAFAMMAKHFKGLSGIDPFTIDQMHLSERRNPLDEEAVYRHVTSTRRIDRPTAFQAADGSWWARGTSHDLKVLHPRAVYRDGRPTWLAVGGRRRPLALRPPALKLTARRGVFAGKEPVLAQAFLLGEGPGAIPVDQILIEPGDRLPVMVLPKGAYRLRVVDRTGAELGAYEVRTR